MRLSAPKQYTFWVAVFFGVFGIIGMFVASIPILGAYAFWLVAIGFVLLVLGTDTGTGWMGIVPGFSIHDELHVLVQSGFSPYEALQTGTVNAAEVVQRMNGNGNFGTIEVGQRADLILVKGNPLEDVAHIRNILGVMASGRWYDKTMLQNLIQ